MYKVLFDGNAITCEDIDVATEVAMALREADYIDISIVPAEPTDVEADIEFELNEV